MRARRYASHSYREPPAHNAAPKKSRHPYWSCVQDLRTVNKTTKTVTASVHQNNPSVIFKFVFLIHICALNCYLLSRDCLVPRAGRRGVVARVCECVCGMGQDGCRTQRGGRWRRLRQRPTRSRTPQELQQEAKVSFVTCTDKRRIKNKGTQYIRRTHVRERRDIVKH